MTGRDDKLRMLSRVGLFATCSTRELQRIASIVDVSRVPAGTVLMREGTPGRECIIVAEGRARVTINARTIATLGPGEIAGEMAILDSAPRSATVTAETPMELLVLDARGFAAVVEAAPSVGRKTMAVLARRLREARSVPAV